MVPIYSAASPMCCGSSNGTEEMELNLEYAPTLVGLPHVFGREYLPPSWHWFHISCLTPTLNSADWSQTIPTLFRKVAQVFCRKSKNGPSGGGTRPTHEKNPSVWKEWIKDKGVEWSVRVFSCSLPQAWLWHTGDEILLPFYYWFMWVFWLILQCQLMNWCSLRYGFPCSGNTSARYLNTTGFSIEFEKLKLFCQAIQNKCSGQQNVVGNTEHVIYFSYGTDRGKCFHTDKNRTNVGQCLKEMKEAKCNESLLFHADICRKLVEKEHQTKMWGKKE